MDEHLEFLKTRPNPFLMSFVQANGKGPAVQERANVATLQRRTHPVRNLYGTCTENKNLLFSDFTSQS
jgi:hypothetical protein